MSAGIYNTDIEQGATWSRVITWKDSSGVGINLTGYSVSGKVKLRISDKKELTTFTVVISNQTTNPGQFTVSLSAATTASFPYKYTENGSREVLELQYDIEATIGSTVYRILQGVLSEDPEATKT